MIISKLEDLQKFYWDWVQDGTANSPAIWIFTYFLADRPEISPFASIIEKLK